MKEILEHIVKSLVTNKDKEVITEDIKDKIVHYNVSVEKSVFGKVIGHEGKIDKSIRVIMDAVAIVNDVKVIVDIR